eukprot:1157133-Pelagomonas_calceolata.AAC.2
MPRPRASCGTTATSTIPMMRPVSLPLRPPPPPPPAHSAKMSPSSVASTLSVPLLSVSHLHPKKRVKSAVAITEPGGEGAGMGWVMEAAARPSAAWVYINARNPGIADHVAAVEQHE